MQFDGKVATIRSKYIYVVLFCEGKTSSELAPGDAFVIPPSMKTRYTSCTNDLELLEVSLPGEFKTIVF